MAGSSILIIWGRAAVVAAAMAAALVPTPPAWVERFYSTAAYTALQPVMTTMSNRAPFALFDVLLAVVSAAWVGFSVRDAVLRTRSGRRPALVVVLRRIAVRTMVWASVLYLAFLIVWGLNYRRTPLVEKLAFDSTAVNAEAARSLAERAVEQLNSLHANAHREGWPAADAVDASLADALVRAHHDLGGAGVVTVGRPKTTLLDWYFRRTVTDGMTDPFFLETLVSSTLLPFERPFVHAHEWSHLAGLADEGDANFLAWLACVRASPPAQYSGWLFLYSELIGSLPRDVRADVASGLAPGPRADLEAIRNRVLQDLAPRLAAAGRRLYDRYLKANRIESGIESYGRVVQLVLGVRFGPDWTVRRPSAPTP